MELSHFQTFSLLRILMRFINNHCNNAVYTQYWLVLAETHLFGRDHYTISVSPLCLLNVQVTNQLDAVEELLGPDESD